MKEPLISVLVPVYKIDKYIGICVESIINQTYRNLEIILVDDGSPDRCPDICDLYASKDKRIKVIHKQNGGLVSARKAGLLASKGEYIGYVDGDDWIGPGFYQALLHSIQQSDSDIAVAGFCRDLFSRTKNILNSISSGVYEGQSLDNIRTKMLSFGSFYQHGITTYLWNKLFKRETIIETQLAVDERITIGEDAAVVYNAIFNCKRMVITDNCAYHYRQREDSMLKLSSNYVQEYERLKILNDFMLSTFSTVPSKYNLKQQVKEFITGTYIIRSGGRLENASKELKYFPFTADVEDKKILVYGAGTFGQQLVKRFKKDRLAEIVGWVDDDYWEYRRCCMDVDPVLRVCAQDYDYILIAILSPILIREIKKELLDFGVQENRIITISVTNEQINLAYDMFLLNSIIE